MNDKVNRTLGIIPRTFICYPFLIRRLSLFPSFTEDENLGTTTFRVQGMELGVFGGVCGNSVVNSRPGAFNFPVAQWKNLPAETVKEP